MACAALIASVCSCGGIAEKVRIAREVTSAMVQGHTYTSYSAANDAMAPAVHTHDFLLVDTSVYATASPQRGDVIIFSPPVVSKRPFFKRVIGLPGDRVSIAHGKITVNGRPVPWAMARPNYDLEVANFEMVRDHKPLEPAIADLPTRAKWSAPDRLPSGCFFVLGDDTNDSEDSHVFGCAELRGRFSAGPRRGQATKLVGKVVKVIAHS